MWELRRLHCTSDLCADPDCHVYCAVDFAAHLVYKRIDDRWCKAPEEAMYWVQDANTADRLHFLIEQGQSFGSAVKELDEQRKKCHYA